MASDLTLLSVDVGTSSAKALLYRHGAGVLAEDWVAYRTHHPKPGWVEQDPDEVLAAVIEVVRRPSTARG